MKKTLVVLAALVLAGCSSLSSVTHPNGTVEKTTDFAASTHSNQRMYEAQADVMWNAQEAVKACYQKANTDVQIMACSMHGMATGYSQARDGRPQPNRNPSTEAEVQGAAAEKAVDTAGKVGVAKVIGDGLGKITRNAKVPQANVSNSYNTTTSTTTSTTPGE